MSLYLPCTDRMRCFCSCMFLVSIQDLEMHVAELFLIMESTWSVWWTCAYEIFDVPNIHFSLIRQFDKIITLTASIITGVDTKTGLPGLPSYSMAFFPLLRLVIQFLQSHTKCITTKVIKRIFVNLFAF